MSDVKVVRERAGTILNDEINKCLFSFLCGFLWPPFGNLSVTLCNYQIRSNYKEAMEHAVE
jgi:hypothetical protein